MRAMVGDRFGRLVVNSLFRAERWRAVCRCDCGTHKDVTVANLINGSTNSCGCLAKEKQISSALIHGHTKNGRQTPEYRSWRAMLERCENPRSQKFKDYGGRGVIVCDAWRDFSTFIRDMGEKPTPKHTIDRYPNGYGNYEPGNCRWATNKEQARNTRKNVFLTISGESKTMAGWAEVYGISPDIVWRRIRKDGWDPLKALTQTSMGVSLKKRSANGQFVPG